ncbi:DUF5361 domain-containing protein [Nocardia cyriacigeorgica]|uniref:DUF5361 domain-containing protein n=1 Tax=Nocardia cyriacigeorgica TaxID=135487 RepID=UPI0013BB5BDC|nr:DUF5361 domain-containing protein [Nocardia cyriacigeorgica]NEW49331.1 DUF5361 domain-containing protein [Nocardia cyriacigeorgica]
MARALGSFPGGIFGLDQLIEAYRTAVAAHLIEHGLRLRHLGTDALTWDDLHAIITHVAPGSVLDREFRPTEWSWQLPELLMASMADSLAWLVWSKTKAAARGTGMPDRIPRPGVKPRRERIGNQPVSIAAMNRFLGWG